MKGDNNDVFIELLRSGLWEKDVQAFSYNKIDYNKVFKLAHDQAVIGLVAAGIEHTRKGVIPNDIVLSFVSSTLQIEQRNKDMNNFIEDLVKKMRDADIYTLLVKGQGVAQCYERPLWRTSGDIDFLLSPNNYIKAKRLLFTMASSVRNEAYYSLHQGLYIGQWNIELHGTLRSGLSSSVDKVIDVVQRDCFYTGSVRSWMNGNTQVFLPAPTNDVFLVFTHFIKHFYKGGVNIRQICDWCRMIWTYHPKLDKYKLEKYISEAGLKSEWAAFAALAVNYLGMPAEAMPFYRSSKKWSKKADKIYSIIIKGGDWYKIQDTIAVGKIFPLSVLRFSPGILCNFNWLKIKERLLRL